MTCDIKKVVKYMRALLLDVKFSQRVGVQMKFTRNMLNGYYGQITYTGKIPEVPQDYKIIKNYIILEELEDLDSEIRKIKPFEFDNLFYRLAKKYLGLDSQLQN